MSERRGLSPTAAGIAFFVCVPLVMAGVIPWWMTRWQFQPPLLDIDAGRWLGAIMIAIGLPLLISAIAWLAHEGVKPYPPIKRLITNGPFAYTRNPMYLGVVLSWFTAFYIFEITIDDPFIRKHIGQPYDDYMKNVPCWIPRRPRRAKTVK